MRTTGTRLRLVALVVAVVGATLVACGSGGSGSSAGGQTVVEFWTHTHPPMVELNEELIAEYEEQNPNVDIQYQTIPNNEFGTKMLTAVSSGTGPDVINMDDSALRGEYIPKELISPVDTEALGYGSVDELTNAYEPRTLGGAAGPDGTLYGLPSEFNTTAFAINTQHFEDAGLDPSQPPRSWQDVISMGSELTTDDRQGFNFLYLHEGWYMQQYQTLLRQTGGQMLSEDKSESLINQDGAVEALQLWYDMIVNQQIGDPDESSREATQPFNDFATGNQSMTLIYPWAVDQIEQNAADTFDAMQVVPLPQLNPDDPVTRWYGYYWAVTSYSEVKPQAWDFVSFLASHPERWLEDVNFVQPVTGWADSEAAQNIPFADAWATAYRTGEFDEIGPNYQEIKMSLKRAIERSIFNGVAPEDSLTTADQEIDDILSN